MKLEEYCEIIQKSQPVLKYCERFDQSSHKWDYSRHSHPYIELIFFLEGKMTLTAADTSMNASVYDTLVYPANYMHQDGKNLAPVSEIICFWVDIPELVLDKIILMHEGNRNIRDLFLMIYEEQHRNPPNPYLVESAIKVLLMMILRDQSEIPEGEQFLNEIIQYIDRHYNERITLEQLAQRTHISKSYLTRRFRQFTGETVVTYINRLRLQYARELLINTDRNISEIAWDVGFESPKYFHRVFKRETGMSPAGFRRSGRNAPVVS
ncbi:MAG: helix-turn-helix domain-containing protein [Lachnospiraceae bacterium]|nr:helix-turn-helix domain-containing protein [Lachnospiraceae bacterium]